jgi:hypothetical protein
MMVTALLALSIHSTNVFAMGNHPEAKLCSAERPYYAVCTAGSHDLQGWTGPCHATREEAEKDAAEHAHKSHHGVTQWTGVARTSGSGGYSDNRGLPP